MLKKRHEKREQIERILREYFDLTGANVSITVGIPDKKGDFMIILNMPRNIVETLVFDKRRGFELSFKDKQGRTIRMFDYFKLPLIHESRKEYDRFTVEMMDVRSYPYDFKSYDFKVEPDALEMIGDRIRIDLKGKLLEPIEEGEWS